MRESYNYLTPFLKELTNDHLECLASHTPEQRVAAIELDDEDTLACFEMKMIDQEGNLTAIGDLIVLEIENRIPV